MILLFKQKRTQKLGSGVFTVARKVLPKQNRKAKAGALTGKVIKPLWGASTTQEGLRLKRLVAEYGAKLERAGINALPTMVRFTAKRANSNKVFLIQPFVEKRLILTNYFKHCSPKEAVRIFEELHESILKMADSNKKNKHKFGMDISPENFAIVDGKLTLIDLYPPFVMNSEEITSRDLIQKARGAIVMQIKNNIAPSYFNRRAEYEIQKRLTPEKLRQRILKKFSALRPELREEFKKINNKYSSKFRVP